MNYLLSELEPGGAGAQGELFKAHEKVMKLREEVLLADVEAHGETMYIVE